MAAYAYRELVLPDVLDDHPRTISGAACTEASAIQSESRLRPFDTPPRSHAP